jgi:DNA processing protein
MGDQEPTSELTHWLALRHCPGVSDRNALALFRRLGQIDGLAGQDHRALRDAGLGDPAIRALRANNSEPVAADLAWAESRSHRILCWTDPDYPEALRDIPDPPIVLYALGDVSLLAVPSLAMVGSRNPTPDGERNAFAFARHLADAGLGITSGLAEGIDTAAHLGALDADGITIAVLGTGPDIAYPASNTELMARIADRGVVVTEFSPGTPAQRDHFPRRNRLISGLSLGTLVVEAARQSGSLITARLAGEQGRDVFAMPGSIHNPMARGCHRLIRQGAKLVETADDVLSELAGHLSGWSPAVDQADDANDESDDPATTEPMDPDYEKLCDALGDGPVTMDVLVSRSGLTTDALSSMLLIMELEGQIRALPGGTYMRITARSDA